MERSYLTEAAACAGASSEGDAGLRRDPAAMARRREEAFDGAPKVGEFDWLLSWAQLEPRLRSILDAHGVRARCRAEGGRPLRALVLGCGNSGASAGLVRDGLCDEVLSVDYDEGITAHMRLRCAAEPRLLWETVDLTAPGGVPRASLGGDAARGQRAEEGGHQSGAPAQRHFVEAGAYDLVLDKGTLDAMLCDDAAGLLHCGATALRCGGVYVTVSLYGEALLERVLHAWQPDRCACCCPGGSDGGQGRTAPAPAPAPAARGSEGDSDSGGGGGSSAAAAQSSSASSAAATAAAAAAAAGPGHAEHSCTYEYSWQCVQEEAQQNDGEVTRSIAVLAKRRGASSPSSSSSSSPSSAAASPPPPPLAGVLPAAAATTATATAATSTPAAAEEEEEEEAGAGAAATGGRRVRVACRAAYSEEALAVVRAHLDDAMDWYHREAAPMLTPDREGALRAAFAGRGGGDEGLCLSDAYEAMFEPIEQAVYSVADFCEDAAEADSVALRRRPGRMDADEALAFLLANQ